MNDTGTSELVIALAKATNVSRMRLRVLKHLVESNALVSRNPTAMNVTNDSTE